jgi:GT2 family glycosyltransferase
MHPETSKHRTAPRVAIIILNWKGLEDTLACLESLRTVKDVDAKIIVVENGSKDQSAAKIRELFPDVALNEQDENHGYAGGNNIGYEQAKSWLADYVVFLNNDVVVDPDFLRHVLDVMEDHPKIGVAGPTIYYYSQPDVIWSAGGTIDWRRGNTDMVGLGQHDEGQFGILPRPVEWITGCAFFVRTAVIEQIGGFDERFFAYYEETEFCLRARRAGWFVVHVPAAKIWHKITPTAREASPLVNYYMARNRLLLMRLGRFGLSAWMIALFSDYLLRYVNWLINPRWRIKKQQRKALFRAAFDYFGGRFGKMDLGSE